jgi:hypothetical protein
MQYLCSGCCSLEDRISGAARSVRIFASGHLSRILFIMGVLESRINGQSSWVSIKLKARRLTSVLPPC